MAIEGNIIWVALLVMCSSLLLREINDGMGTRRKIKLSIGGVGWILFSIHWFGQPSHYLHLGDAFNAMLTFMVALFCLLISYSLIRCNSDDRYKILMLVSRVTVLTGTIYFPFSQIPYLLNGIIYGTAHLTTQMVNLMGFPAYLDAPNLIWVGNLNVDIVLACTAIESVALFTGVILGVKSTADRRMRAFIVSVPVIYVLNLLRNAFVVIAYTQSWFGTPMESFYMAHHVISKMGSTISLCVVAYAVFIVLPESLNMIEDVWRLVRGDI